VSSRSGTRRGHTIPGLRRRSTVTRARRNRTLPHGWTARVPVATTVTPTDTNIRVSEDVNGPDGMLCLESLRLEGDLRLEERQKDVIGQEAGDSCDVSSVGSENITDDVASGGEDIWFDVSDIAVVDEPLR
jgi:hypothetical protein